LRRMNFSRRTVLFGIAIAASVPLSGCKVVSIATQRKDVEAAAFDPKAWADKIWTPKVLPYFSMNAKPLLEVIKAISQDFDGAGKSLGYRPAAEGSPWTFVVSGSGTVVKKNTASRAGTLDVTLDGGDPNQRAVVRIGPVIIGSAILNALPFVSFKDFTNQIDYADAGKALTALALAGISPVLPSIKEGSKVSFTGALSMTSKSDDIAVVPVTLAVTP